MPATPEQSKEPLVFNGPLAPGDILRHFFIFAIAAWFLPALANAKSTFPMPPRLKPVPESAIVPLEGVPRKMDQEKMTISDTYVFSDKKVSEVAVWYWDDMELVFAGTIPIGGTFEPEAIFSRYGRMYYGISKIDAVKAEPWLVRHRNIYKNKVVTLYVDGGYVKRGT